MSEQALQLLAKLESEQDLTADEQQIVLAYLAKVGPGSWQVANKTVIDEEGEPVRMITYLPPDVRKPVIRLVSPSRD